MIKLNVGSTWEIRQLDLINDLNQHYTDTKVTEVYGSIGAYPTARSFDRLPSWDEKRFKDYMTRAKEVGIDVKWTMNQSCLGNLDSLDETMYKHIVRNMLEFDCHKYIVTSPLLIELIREYDPKAWFEMSTISRVTSVKEIQNLSSLGINSLCWDVMQNRNIPLIKQAVKFMSNQGIQLEMIANEFCVYMCEHRNTCYNLSSHNSKRDRFGGYPFSRCIERRMLYPQEWIKARFILPTWLMEYYSLGADQFKITGRTHSTDEVIRVLRHYMDLTNPDDLLDLWHHVEVLVGGKPAGHPVISTQVLEDNDMLGRIMSKGGMCEKLACGVDCTYCDDLFEEAYVERD